MKPIGDLLAPLVARARDRRQRPEPVEPFDFEAAILDDPRAVPRPDVPVPAWLRLPIVDDPQPPSSPGASPPLGSGGE